MYLESITSPVQNETPSVPYYSAVPESAGVMLDICGEKTLFYLDFEKEILSVIFSDSLKESETEIYGYGIDYTVAADYELIGGIVDAVDGIDLEVDGEILRYTGVQVAELLTTTSDHQELRREITQKIIDKIADNGFSRQDFLYVIENSETDLTVPACYYWTDQIKAVCKSVRIVN